MLFAGIGAAAADERVEQLKKAIEATTDVKEQARLHRQLGEHYVAQDQLDEAAEQYLKALSLAREVFSAEERKTMAVHLSWAGRLKEALAEFRGVVAEEPGNLDARVHLARALSWAGEYGAAVREADRVLRESPGNRDALLVKANGLRWGGDPVASLPIYRQLLQEKEDFETRLGLSYALLETGDLKGARETSRALAPQLGFQEKDLQKYLEAEKAATRPSIDLRYSYLEDTDDNIVNTYTLLYGFLIQNWRLTVRLGHTDAEDPRRDVRADSAGISASVPVTPRLRVRGGVGVSRLENGDASNVPTGHVGGEAKVWRGTVGAGISREALTDTAQVIDNEIKVTDAELVVFQQLTGRVSFYGEYHYRDYSNTNSAHDLLLSPTYVVYAGNPRISISYRFRYRDFDRQTGGGYFDPQGYVAHQGTGTLSFELGRLYGTGYVFGGYESFRDPEQEEGDFLGGGGTLGFRPTSNLSLEIDGITSSAAGPAAGGPGFRFFSVGARLLYRF